MAAPAFALAGTAALPRGSPIKSPPAPAAAAAPGPRGLTSGSQGHFTAALAAALLAAGQVTAGRRARTARCARRPRVDPDAITAMDTQVAAQYSGLSQGVGSSKTKVGKIDLGGSSSTARPEKAPTTEEQKQAMALAVEEAAKDGIPNMLAITEVERADLIEGLTRKAFVLMDAGEIDEAQKLLRRATQVADAFQKLQDIIDRRVRKQTDEEFLNLPTEGNVLVALQKELHGEDFSEIFGGKARWASFIGGW